MNAKAPYPSDITVSVFRNGRHLVDIVRPKRVCPNGEPGVVYKGAVYPVDESSQKKRIEVSETSYSKDDCLWEGFKESIARLNSRLTKKEDVHFIAIKYLWDKGDGVTESEERSVGPDQVGGPDRWDALRSLSHNGTIDVRERLAPMKTEDPEFSGTDNFRPALDELVAFIIRGLA